MIDQLKQKWQSLPTNDRRIYSILGFIVGLALVYAFIWLPSQQARSRLSASIQEKKAQLAQMRSQTEQVKTLQSAIKLSHSNQQGLKSAIDTSANLHGMSGKITKTEADAQGAINISIPSISFDEWVSWIAALQSEHHVRVSKCDIVNLGSAVKIEATLVAE